MHSALTATNVSTDPKPILIEPTVAHNTVRSNTLWTSHLPQLGDATNVHPLFGESRNLIPTVQPEVFHPQPRSMAAEIEALDINVEVPEYYHLDSVEGLLTPTEGSEAFSQPESSPPISIDQVANRFLNADWERLRWWNLADMTDDDPLSPFLDEDTFPQWNGENWFDLVNGLWKKVASFHWVWIENLLKRSSGRTSPRSEVEEADFEFSADQIERMWPEWYRGVLQDTRFMQLHRYVDEYIRPEYTVRLFNKEFLMSAKHFRRWKDGMRFFSDIDYVIWSGRKNARMISALELLVKAHDGEYWEDGEA